MVMMVSVYGDDGDGVVCVWCILSVYSDYHFVFTLYISGGGRQQTSSDPSFLYTSYTMAIPLYKRISSGW